MVDRSPALKVQAETAISLCENMEKLLMVFKNKNLDEETRTVPLPELTFNSIITRIQNDAKLIAKLDKKIDDLNNQLFNL